MKIYFALIGMVIVFSTSCIRTNVTGAKIKFQNNELLFGKIKAGDTTILTFNFQNTGNDTLFIHKVQPSCECMIADYTATPVLPSKYGRIIIKYASNKREDIGKQVKSIIVQTNSDTLLSVLKIVGIVENDSLKRALGQLKRI